MDPILSNYTSLYAQHGLNPESLQWTDKESQYRRFEILCEISKDIQSVTDLGCGLADLYTYLSQKGFTGQYLGLDFVPEFIENNNLRISDKNAKFEVFNIKTDKLTTINDFVILSGVFNNKMEDNEEFMLNTLRIMFENCNKGISFNAMSTYVDYMEDHLFYTDPTKIFDFCKIELSKKVILRHDYSVRPGGYPFEYCIYVYK